MDGNAEHFHQHCVIGDGAEIPVKARAASWAFSRVPRWKPCGVWTARSSSRGAVPVTTSGQGPVLPRGGRTVLTVSTTATAGMTAAARGQSVRDAVEDRLWSEGARGVVHQHRLYAVHQGCQSGPDGIRAGAAAVDDGKKRAAVGQFLPEALAQAAEGVVSGGSATHTWLPAPDATMPRRACIKIGSPPKGTAALGMP